MGKLQPTDKILAARAKANVKKYAATIKDEIVKEAKKKGHSITAKNITRLTFTKVKDVKYDIFDISFDKFVITDPEDLVWLDGMTWTNTGPGDAKRTLHVEESTEDTYNWQITAGFTYQYEQTEKFEIYAPAGGSISNTFKFSFDFHASYGQASKKAHKWSNDFEQDIPAGTAVRMEVRGVQFVGYVPFTIRARAKGQAECECVIDYWGKRTEVFTIDLQRILNEAERTFTSTGKVDGVQGYDWSVHSFTPKTLTAEQKKQLASGVTEQHVLPGSLSLKSLEATVMEH